jgi:hypothetical protein
MRNSVSFCDAHVVVTNTQLAFRSSASVRCGRTQPWVPVIRAWDYRLAGDAVGEHASGLRLDPQRTSQSVQLVRCSDALQA